MSVRTAVDLSDRGIYYCTYVCTCNTISVVLLGIPQYYPMHVLLGSGHCNPNLPTYHQYIIPMYRMIRCLLPD